MALPALSLAPTLTLTPTLAQAKAQGLWNLFLPVDSAAVAGVDQSVVGGGLTNRQYAEICDPNPSPN